MNTPFDITEIKPIESPLEKLSKSFDPLPDSELNKSIEKCTGDFPWESKVDNLAWHDDIPLENRKPNFLGERKIVDVGDLTEGLLFNKEEGLRREDEVEKELKKKYPESEGYTIVSEAYLRDSEGNIVKDPETGEARRVDFVVVKDGVVVDSVEVTSETANKTQQSAKEGRIRAAGGNYIRTPDGSLAQYPDNLETKIERRK